MIKEFEMYKKEVENLKVLSKDLEEVLNLVGKVYRDKKFMEKVVRKIYNVQNELTERMFNAEDFVYCNIDELTERYDEMLENILSDLADDFGEDFDEVVAMIEEE